MKTLKIKTSQLQRIAVSIGNYTFNDLKGGFANNDIDWLSQFCGFYNRLSELSNIDVEETYCMIDVGTSVEKELPGMISRYIFNEIKDVFDFNEDDVEWICEMMNIYNQLIKTTIKQGNATVINTNTADNDQKTDAKKEDGLDPAQIIKNVVDKVEEKKTEKETMPVQEKVQEEKIKPDNKRVTEQYQTSGSKPDADLQFGSNDTESPDDDVDWDSDETEIY